MNRTITVLALVSLALTARPSLADVEIRTRLRGVEVAEMFRVQESASRSVGGGVDLDVFVPQLLAFALKEIFSDTPDEYASFSLLPSRLSDSMPDSRDTFGENCLEVVTRIGTKLQDDGPSVRQNQWTATRTAVGAATTAFFLREAWGAIRNEIRDGREGVSLKPRISSSKFVLAMTFRW